MCSTNHPPQALATEPARPATGSRRRRLWDLPVQCHCPLVGICLPLAALHNLVRKALGPKTPVDDYDVHVGVVAECQKRSPLTEALQQDLERRYAATVQQFKVAKTTESLALLWKKTVDQGHVTGALWAALTHPRCDENLQQVICRNMHMYQHHAGANRQADLTDFSSLQAENALLARELGRVQARSTRFMADKAQDIQQLTTQLVQVRGDNIRKDSRLAFLNADLVALKDTIPDLESSLRLQKKLEQMAARQIELEENLRELRQKLVLAEKSLDTANAALGQKADMALAERPASRTIPIAVDLSQKTVLCVGGRSGNVASYRDVIERVGGRFAHHDGGQEDNHSILDASLSAADLVICQTGCISHNAYWKVKDFCKRTGKRCVFVENPSASSLARGLTHFLVEDDLSLTKNTEVS